MTMIRCLTISVLLAGAAACGDQSSQKLVVTPESAIESNAATSAKDPPARMVPTEAHWSNVSAVEVLSSTHPNLFALSIEEARWLDRHGYPTPEELENLHLYDVAELESAMRNRKDVKAAALLGHRRVLDGNLAGAASAFSVAANEGSLYARQQLGIANLMDVTGLPIERIAEADQGALAILMAQLEMARLLGDHRANVYIDKFGSNFHWNRYGRHVLDQAAEFMRQYGESARARGKRPVGPDPRPNAEAWSQLQADPYSTVTVYRRDGTSP